MSKFKIVNLIDKVFVTFVVFLILFAWINFYLRNLWTTFILSTILTLSLVFIFYSFLSKKEKIKNLKISKKEDVEINFLAFSLLSKKNKLLLINKIVSLENLSKIENNNILYEKNNVKHLLILATDYSILTQTDLMNIISNIDLDKFDIIEIICGDAENLNLNLLKNKKIVVIDKQQLYDNFFSKFNIYPDKTELNLASTKIKFVDIVKGMFSKNKSKGYFFCGFILIFSSILLPYTTYYLISGTILLIFSLICKISKHHLN